MRFLQLLTKNHFATVSLPFLLWTLTMIIVSSMPGTELPKISIFQWDKIAHFTEFAGFSVLFFRYLILRHNLTLTVTIRIVIAVSLAYAALDELHQLLIPFRDCTIYDFIADSFGISAGVFGSYKFFSRKKGINNEDF